MENNQEQFTNSTGIFPIDNIPTQDIPTQNISEADTPAADSKYQPISTWGYIGIILLLSIPIIGPVIAIVWAFGGCRKVNKRNFARASLIISLFMLIAGFVVGMAI